MQIFSGVRCLRVAHRYRANRLVFKPASLLILWALFVSPVFAVPTVVVSIAPLHSLMSELMQGVGEPLLLIEGGQSPHSSRLAPSAHRKIADAELLIWLGASFESSLSKAFAQVLPGAKVVSLLQASTLHKLPIRDSGEWKLDDQEHGHGHADHVMEVGLSPLKLDPHLWLSTENAIEIVSLFADELSLIDPENSNKYELNRVQTIEKIDELKREIARDLKPVTAVPYLVFHDAYHYFEDEFGLSPAGAVTLNPERKPGAKSVRAIEKLIVDQDVRCLFSEPQFEPGLLRRLVEDAGIHAGVLDPLGSEIDPGAGQWFALMRTMRDDLLSCLERPGEGA